MPVQDKVIEIIVYILNELKKGREISEKDIDRLTAKGYTGSDINTALEWFYEKMNSSEVMYSDSKSKSKSYRFFNKAEDIVFTNEAKAFLMQISSMEDVPREELEILIDKLVLSGKPGISEEDIKVIANSSGNEKEKDDFEIRLDSFILNGNETIH